jgi:hypothetical protein
MGGEGIGRHLINPHQHFNDGGFSDFRLCVLYIGRRSLKRKVRKRTKVMSLKKSLTIRIKELGKKN